MNLHFENTAIAFRYKKSKELKLSKWIFTFLKMPMLNTIGIKLILFLLRIKFPIGNILKKTIFKQFVGGETLLEAGKLADKLKEYNIQIILDYGVEGNNNEQDFEKTSEQLINVIQFAQTRSNIPFISIKITGIASTQLLKILNDEPRLRSGIHDNEEQMRSFNKIRDRIYKIAEIGYNNKIGILIDAEESWIQDPIDRLAIELMELYNTKMPIIFNTYQLYRHDRLKFLQINHKIASEKKFILGAKIVRGAYMEKERSRAEKHSYYSPIHINKTLVDEDFNAAIDYCLMNIDTISTIVATHNEDSCIFTTQKMADYQIPFNHPHVWFSQLYGMSDHISFNLSKLNYNVAKYVPFGPLKEVMPYLIRRADENSSVSNQSNRYLQLINLELKKRKI